MDQIDPKEYDEAFPPWTPTDEDMEKMYQQFLKDEAAKRGVTPEEMEKILVEAQSFKESHPMTKREELETKGVSQLMAERFAKGVPRGAYSNNSFEKAGGAGFRTIPDDAEDLYYSGLHSDGGNNTGILEMIDTSSTEEPFHSSQWDAIIETILGETAKIYGDDERLQQLKENLSKTQDAFIDAQELYRDEDGDINPDEVLADPVVQGLSMKEDALKDEVNDFASEIMNKDNEEKKARADKLIARKEGKS